MKFSGNVNPIIFPSPIAISEYPLKSKYIWNVNARIPSHAVTADRLP